MPRPTGSFPDAIESWEPLQAYLRSRNVDADVLIAAREVGSIHGTAPWKSSKAIGEARGRGGLGRQAMGVRAAKDAMSDRTHQRRRLVLCKGTIRAVLVVGPWD
jgi:hypothetical protein